MDRTSAPWRVLDEPAARDGAGGAGDGGGSVDPRAGVAGIGWGTIGAVAVAAVLAVAAFVIAATGPGGTVEVDSVSGGAGSPAAAVASPDPVPGSGNSEIVIDVQGAVVQPGVLHLPAGSRVGDAIAAAGGYGPRVDALRAGRELNLAASLKDGDRIVVPSRDDPPGTGGGGGATAGPGGADGGLVDLNTATASELDALPGIGPVTAQKIIDAREEQPFASVDDLRDRKIVGASAFERLRELVTVR